MRNELASIALLLAGATSCTKAVDSGSPSSTAEEPAPSGNVAPAAVPAKVVKPPFEGTLTVHLYAGSKTVTLAVTTKAGKLRADITGDPRDKAKGEHAYFDPATKQVTLLSDARKTATTAARPAPLAATLRSVNKTGMHELIGGQDCEDWDAADTSGRRETLCVAEGFETLDLNALLPADTGFPPIGSWLADLREKGEFPLRALITDASGAIESHWDLSAIDAHSVDDAAFAVPPGYSAR
jgi:hypothetical protein